MSKTLKDVVRRQRVNDTLHIAKREKTPTSLWKNIWYEGELSCLFADSNVGKSILAVQIADEVAKIEPVMYFDFELSPKQFQMRYTNDEGEIHEFSELLYRADLDPEMMAQYDTDAVIVDAIRVAAEEQGVKILIIDNLTYICNGSEKGDAAGEFMKELMKLKFQHGLSILMIAHTPKRILANPITQNDLAGSKRLFNFFDSVFAVGKSAKSEQLRYIKHLKARVGGIVYGSDNVLICTIDKENAMLKFIEQGEDKEWRHLKTLDSEQKREAEKEQVAEELAKGKSIREIAGLVGMSKTKVAIFTKELNAEKGE